MKPLHTLQAPDFAMKSERRNQSTATRKEDKWSTHCGDGKWFKKTSQIAYLRLLQVAKNYLASVFTSTDMGKITGGASWKVRHGFDPNVKFLFNNSKRVF